MGETCYTAGLDGAICCWTVPSTVGLDIYQTFGNRKFFNIILPLF